MGPRRTATAPVPGSLAETRLSDGTRAIDGGTARAAFLPEPEPEPEDAFETCLGACFIWKDRKKRLMYREALGIAFCSLSSLTFVKACHRSGGCVLIREKFF